MAAQLRFIHAADLHIGAPFRGLRELSPAWAERLVEAIPQAYDRLVDAALEHQVDFVVFAGDIFDPTSPCTAATVSRCACWAGAATRTRCGLTTRT